MKKFLIVLVIAVPIGWYLSGQIYNYKKAKYGLESMPIKILADATFKEIPGGLNNFSSAQPALDELAKFIREHRIKVVIRLNGDKENRSFVSIQEERDSVQAQGAVFVYKNAHEGYVENKGYLRSNQHVNDYLMEGNVLVHCLHGYDRTGSVVGYHLRELGFDKSTVIEHNEWENYIARKGRDYRKYYEAIY